MLLSCSLFLLLAVGRAFAYEPTWDSLDARQLPQWYADAKVCSFAYIGLGVAIAKESLLNAFSISTDWNFPALGRLFGPIIWI